MSLVKNKALVRHFFEVSVEESLAIVDETMAPDFVYHTLEGDLNRDLYKQVNAAVLAAFPDVRYAVDDMIAEGDRVVTRWTMQATHQGEFNGIPATNKAVTLTGVSIDRLVGGKIVETWQFYDALGFLQQLGAIPASG